MNPAEYDTMHQVEQAHWWYRGLRSMLDNALRHLDLTGTPTILDAGCGTGANLNFMRQRIPNAHFIAFDLSPAALGFIATAPNITAIQGDANTLPLADESVDVILAADLLGQRNVKVGPVLDHFFRVLKPGGTLLANIPAFEWLRGQHDLAVHVDKRFSPSELATTLSRTGFTEIREHFWNLFMLPPMFIRRLFTRRAPSRPAEPHSDLTLRPAWLNRLLTITVQTEIKLSHHIRQPLGSSLFVIARKPHRHAP
jgi:SAM-dependent methyltransferase